MALAISFIADSLKLHAVCGLGCLPSLQIKLEALQGREQSTLKTRTVDNHFDCKNDHCGLLNVQRPLGFRQFQSYTLSSTREAKDSI